MKTLKLKGILFSLLTIATVSIFISSCKKEPITPIEEEIIFNDELITEDQLKISNDIENIFTSGKLDKNCFIKHCYSSCLGRCGEQSGINYWLAELDDTSINKIVSVALGFITSEEASDKWEDDYSDYLSSIGINESQVSKSIYITYRGLNLREPDVRGGMHWTDYANQHGLENAVKALTLTPEFFRRLRNISTECNTYNLNCN